MSSSADCGAQIGLRGCQRAVLFTGFFLIIDYKGYVFYEAAAELPLLKQRLNLSHWTLEKKINLLVYVVAELW